MVRYLSEIIKMEQSSVELIKLTTPFFQIIVTVILIPLIKKGYESRRTFFSLPLQKKMDAIAYLKRHQSSDSRLEKAKHKSSWEDIDYLMMWNYQRELLNFTVRMRKKTPGFVKQSLVRDLYYF